ncbi:unnamed protein product, partial [Anisakis simplex]|uniref:Probable splicing factor, arginine/serine-rich 3 (inferred by orthology to a C. elegans protein) n=1 Tax=Anisakis simplex TaxID=6269 RepID=A0A0M3K7T2_ANISI
MMGSKRDCRVYVGNLPSNIKQRDLEDLFDKYGRICFIDVKYSRGAPFAFLEFEDPRDAEDAIRGRDGYDLDGCRIRVELTRGVGPRGPGGRPIYAGGAYDRRPAPAPRDRRLSSGGRDSSRKSGYRVNISGLPTSGSWQDLKVYYLSYIFLNDN